MATFRLVTLLTIISHLRKSQNQFNTRTRVQLHYIYFGLELTAFIVRDYTPNYTYYFYIYI